MSVATEVEGDCLAIAVGEFRLQSQCLVVAGDGLLILAKSMACVSDAV